MRHTLSLLLGLAGIAAANCTDSLFLQVLEVHRQTVRNDSVMGDWTRVNVDPWDLHALESAGRPGFPGPGMRSDTAQHYLRLASNCGSDSIAQVAIARVIDTVIRSGGANVHRVTVDTFSTRMKVDRAGEGAGTIGYGEYTFDFFWESPVFQIGKQQDSSSIASWYGATRTCRFASASGTSCNSYFAPTVPVRALVVDAFASNLRSQASAVRAVGSSLDSVKTEIVLFRALYGTSIPAGVRRASSTAAGLSARIAGSELELSLERASRVRLVRLDGTEVASWVAPAGRSLRRFPAAGSGLWIVRADGLGAVPVLSR